MENAKNSSRNRLLPLVLGLLKIPPGRNRILTAFAYGLTCHIIFVLAVGAMIVAMFFGMSESLGNIPKPWSYLANLLLIIQFPLTHSFLLSRRGSTLLRCMGPVQYSDTLSTTTYAIIASFQLLLLFTLWTPSGTVWWRADGPLFYLICGFYLLSWLLLIKASYDAGAEVQSGALGWMSLAQNMKPIFPDMPTKGLFRLVRQPIYVSFALTLWTVPVWTPDQFILAIILTSYCLIAPRLKEARFRKRYGARFMQYQSKVPYAFPHWKRKNFDDEQ